MFDTLVGNEPVKTYLRTIVERDRVGNSYLFSGPEGVGKGLFALALARQLVNDPKGRDDHPDIHIYRPEGKIGSHSIESLRQFSEEVYTKPYEAKWKVFIIHDADRMLPYSANALLKTFEEPAEDALIILLTSSPENILPTVLSRCRRVFFHAVEKEEIASFLIQYRNVDQKQAEEIAASAKGSIARALHLLEKGEDPSHQLLFELLSKAPFRTYYDLKEAAKALADRIEESRAEQEKHYRHEMAKIDPKEMSALHKESLEKEVLGASAVKYRIEVDHLLSRLTSWFRDAYVLSVGGSSLENPSYRELIASKEHRVSLDKLLEYTWEARLSTQRFSPLSHTLETLFLKLGLLE